MTETQWADHSYYMGRALELAEQAYQAGEVPVGAIVVLDGVIVGEGYNRPISSCDPTAHAEVVALRQAALKAGNYRLPGARLYVTIEPCSMCVGALMHARIGDLVYGAREPKAGVVESQTCMPAFQYWNHRLQWQGGVLAVEAGAIMSRFFQERRAQLKTKQSEQK